MMHEEIQYNNPIYTTASTEDITQDNHCNTLPTREPPIQPEPIPASPRSEESKKPPPLIGEVLPGYDIQKVVASINSEIFSLKAKRHLSPRSYFILSNILNMWVQTSLAQGQQFISFPEVI